MKKTLILLAAAIPSLAQQTFDFKLLDKLGANAKESTNITLDGDTLKLASNFLGDDKDSIKSLVNGLKGVYVRSWEFAQAGQYKEADLAPLRAYLNGLQWKKIVDVKETNETSEIFLQPLPNNKLGGLAIISAEPKEVTVVFISGVLSMDDVSKLSGNMGIPELPSLTVTHGGKNSAAKAPTGKKDD